MGLKVGVCVLLIVLGIIAVQGKYKSPLHDQARNLRVEHKPLPRYEAKRGEFFKVPDSKHLLCCVCARI